MPALTIVLDLPFVLDCFVRILALGLFLTFIVLAAADWQRIKAVVFLPLDSELPEDRVFGKLARSARRRRRQRRLFAVAALVIVAAFIYLGGAQ